jgi:hypothetical protein
MLMDCFVSLRFLAMTEEGESTLATTHYLSLRAEARQFTCKLQRHIKRLHAKAFEAKADFNLLMVIITPRKVVSRDTQAERTL